MDGGKPLIMDIDEPKVFFGSKKMSREDMEDSVDAVFDSVANKYDLMNNLMSFGLHKLWKRKAIDFLSLNQVKDNGLIIDIASGTCDLGEIIKSREKGRLNLVCSDKNHNMLRIGRNKMIDEGVILNTNFCCFDALNIPLVDNSVDRVITAFGLRNFSDKSKGLSEIFRILRPGGKCVILEFSKIHGEKFRKLYELYSKSIIPILGETVAADKESYEYLISSIENHPDQNSVMMLMEKTGFFRSNFYNIFSGLISIHWGYKT